MRRFSFQPSIRLRLTLLYSAILALTLVVFGITLYTIQANYTLDSLKRDLTLSGDDLAQSILRNYLDPSHAPPPRPLPPPPMPFDTLSGEQAFKNLREREIVRVLNSDGTLVSSPFSGEDALPLSAAGLQAVRSQQLWWETASPAGGPSSSAGGPASSAGGDRLLVYDRPVVEAGQVVFIVQVARPLTERDRSLASLSRTLIVASLLTTLVAFGIGWVLSGAALRPIHRIAQTAEVIGSESDFTRRVDYQGPKDEIGHLAMTFNSMLARLQDAYQSVSQALKMQRDFVADVSHELRTPLTTVRGNLALLRRQPSLPAEEQADILADLTEESDRLIRLVNDLLVLARADSGRSLLQEPVAVRPIIEEACRQARQLDRQRQILEEAPDICVLGDRDALKQVLLILLDNALKHSQGTIRVTAESAGVQVVVRVCDEGPGIPSAALEHVFDRFYRGEAGRAVPGFGLGLPIAKALMEGQGGSIAIESPPGGGTRVQVRLPWASLLKAGLPKAPDTLDNSLL